MKSCEYCGVDHDGSFGSGRFCSKKCSHGFSSREKRASINEKISAKLKNTGHPPVICICKNCECEFSRPWTKRASKFCSRSCKQIYENTHAVFTDERKKNLSKAVKSLYSSGKKVYGGKTKWFVYKDIKVQGTYELRACKILDKWKEQKKILDWEYTKDRVQYVGPDGKSHSYLLDFKVFRNDGSFYYVETKGYVKDIDLLKWAEVSKNNDLEVWREAELKQHELKS